jgi:ankyrin repeat protein
MLPTDRLVEAVKAGEAAAVARYLDAEPALADAREHGVSLLLMALYYGHPGVAELFAARRRRLDVHELAALGRAGELREALARVPELAQQIAVDGFTPLGLAAFFCHEHAAVALLDAGADPRMPSRNEMRVAPLHSAVARRCLSAARILLDRGADVNARQTGGFTPLHGAAANGDRAMTELLIDRGADPSLRNDEGRTARDLALERGHAGIADWLGGIAGG